MGKIICEVCGTSYSEAATQCPICGCVRPANTENLSVTDHDTTSVQTQYQYVRGGRFSKANVKKRNKKKQAAATVSATEATADETKPEKSNKGLIITVLALLLAIIAVITYIAVTIVIPIMFPEKDKVSVDAELGYSDADSLESTQDLSCTSITVDPLDIIFNDIGETVQISAAPIPSNTSDVLIFTSADESVASVDAGGLVTAVGPGETIITATCGSVNVSCSVAVPEVEPEFALNRDDITFSAIGEEWLVYTGSLPLSDIVWNSDDEAIASITNGNIVATGNGITTVYGEYNGIIASCIVRCEIQEPTEEETVPVADNGPYRLENPYGFSDTDASIKVGGSFTLYLLDKNEDKVSSGVVWTVEEGSCCTVDNGTVTGVSVGQAKVVATYGGESYTCIVRVS